MLVTILADDGDDEGLGLLPLLSYREFDSRDVSTLSVFLKEQIDRTQGVMMIIVGDYQTWAYSAIRETFPLFPPALLSGAGDTGLAMLPLFDDVDRECCYVMDHIDIVEDADMEYVPGPTRLKLGGWAAHRESVGTWIREKGAITEAPDRPVLAVLCREGVQDKLCRHYLANGERWRRLRGCPYWVYLDTFYVMTNWDSTLEIARFNLETKEQVLFNRKAMGSIIHQTKELHRDASATLSLQETIRLHQESLRQFKRGLGRQGKSPARKALFVRLESVAMQLDYYAGTAATILEQQKNLISLMFDLENITQGEAVSRLNGLAFIFLPLSFVATVFGITTLETPAHWYPVAAVPVLALTICAALGINRGMTYLESRKSSRRELNQTPPPPTSAPRPPISVPQTTHTSSPIRNLKEKDPVSIPEIKLEPPRSRESTPAAGSGSKGNNDTHGSSRVITGNKHRTSTVVGGEPQGLRPHEHEILEDPSRHVRSSSAALGFRVSGVARVDSDSLRTHLHADASPGALRSPSGTLRRM